jgi:hypothetical protein
MIRQAFGEGSMSRTRVFKWTCSVQGRPKEARQVKSKVRSMLTTCFGIKGILRKEFALAGQTDNSANYCHVLRRLRENVRRLRPELWRQTNWLLLHDSATSHHGIVAKSNMTVVPPPTIRSSLSLIEGKFVRRTF